MRTSTSRRRRGAAAVLLFSALLASAVTLAEPAAAAAKDAPTTPTGATTADVHVQADGHRATPSHRTGKAALSALGHRVDATAKKAGLTRAQLHKAFLEDSAIGVDRSGNAEASDALGGVGTTVTTGRPDVLLWSVGSTNYLHSRPGATKKIFLDFNGHTTTGTQWNIDVNRASFTTPVFGRDADPTTWSTSEAAAIQASYASVAEDFAAYDVDVTTQDPGIEALRRTSSTDASYGVRVVVGPNTWLNVSNSGFAKIGSFDWASDTPAYCFVTAATSTKQIADCISHETGHTVGLLHDGQYGEAYYAGHANWAPIMGNPYFRPMTQWSKGQYPGATNTQDDIFVIGSYLGWVADDYAGTTATTATLPAGSTRTGRITWGSGEYDAFRFSLTGTRTVNIQSWEWIQQVDTDLNMRVQLTDSAGTTLLTSSPTDTVRTNLTTTLAAGTYYVFLSGVGEGTTSTGYTNYASMGFYNLLLQLV